MSSKINDMLDDAAGKAQKAQGESLNTFLASLTTSGIIFGLGVISFIFLKSRFPECYPQKARQTSGLGWKPVSFSPRMLFLPIREPDLKRGSWLDNYFFDRYLHTIARIFLLLGLIIPPILIPLNVVDGKNERGGVKGLDRLSFSNVGLSHTDRYWAHLVAALLVVISVCYILRLELRYHTKVQSRMGTAGRSSLLVVANSKQQLSVKAIRGHFHKIAGGIHTIRLNRDYSSLRAKFCKRDASIRGLEAAETDLIRKANRRRKLLPRIDNEADSEDSHLMPLWMKYLQQEDRPSMRLPLLPWLPSLPFIGPQVDAIYHSSAEVAQYNVEIERDQKHPENFPQTNSAFVHFNRRIPTQLAALALKTRIPPSWTLKHGTTENDTVWRNVSISWWQQCTRTGIVYLLAAVVILGFAFPVAIIGSLSQIEYLANIAPWLQWMGALPNWLIAAIQGVLPPVMLGAVTAMVPVTLRLLANMQGLHSRQAIENSVQIYYFAFLFVQVFLTASLSAGITTIVGELTDSIEVVPAVLAQNLPKACNYFFSYIMIHTITVVVCTLVQISGLINLFVLSPVLDKTARQKWVRTEGLGLQKWGTFLPVFTNIACIVLIYSVIAPLVLIFSIACFGALWVLYRSYPPKLTEVNLVTYGLFYPTAIRQLFTGVYFMELCLTGLFFLVRDVDGKATCTAQAVIMIAATVLTASFQYSLDHGHGMHWLSLKRFINRQVDQTRCKTSGQLDWGCRTEDQELSSVEPTQADLSQDEALSSTRPVIWIPKDSLGIADDEICQLRRAYDCIWISNEGATLNEEGKLKPWGSPPEKLTGQV